MSGCRLHLWTTALPAICCWDVQEKSAAGACRAGTVPSIPDPGGEKGTEKNQGFWHKICLKVHSNTIPLLLLLNSENVVQVFIFLARQTWKWRGPEMAGGSHTCSVFVCLIYIYIHTHTDTTHTVEMKVTILYIQIRTVKVRRATGWKKS